jgi:hypothetical protein
VTTYSLSHLSDPALLRALAALVARDRTTTAALLAHIGEVDARKLYLPAAHPSMYSYCVHELRLSEQTALKRIRVARTARQYPAIFAAVAEGQLQLSAVILLAPHLTPETADELLAAATHKTHAEVEQFLAQRFPRPDVPARIEAVVPPDATTQLTEPLSTRTVEAPATVPLSTWTVGTSVPRPGMTPLSPQRFALQMTVGQGTHDKLRYAQALLSHQIPSGDMADVLDRALDALIGQLERRKFAATSEPRRRARRPTASPRHIPADVKRAVWQRDGGRCTFASDNGQRCPARTRLEFDHVEPVARGGQASVAGIRLRCRAHNQYGAECTFGKGFMDDKREKAGRAATERRTAAARARAAARVQGEDVIPWLRALGFRADEACRAAARCETVPDAPLEQRVRHALSCLGRGTRVPSRGEAHGPRGREAP